MESAVLSSEGLQDLYKEDFKAKSEDIDPVTTLKALVRCSIRYIEFRFTPAEPIFWIFDTAFSRHLQVQRPTTQLLLLCPSS